MHLTRPEGKHSRLLPQHSQVFLLIHLPAAVGEHHRLGFEVLSRKDLDILENHLRRAASHQHTPHRRSLGLPTRESSVPHGLGIWSIDGLSPYVRRVRVQQLREDGDAIRHEVVVCGVAGSHGTGALHIEPRADEDSSTELRILLGQLQLGNTGARSRKVRHQADEEMSACTVASHDELRRRDTLILEQRAQGLGRLDQLAWVLDVGHQRVLEEDDLAGAAGGGEVVDHVEVADADQRVEVAAAVAVEERGTVGIAARLGEGDEVQHRGGDLGPRGAVDDIRGDGDADFPVREGLGGAAGADLVAGEGAVGKGVGLARVEDGAACADEGDADFLDEGEVVLRVGGDAALEDAEGEAGDWI